MANQRSLEPYVLFEERNRIAEELHDRIGPYLFGIVCAIHSLEQDWREKKGERHLRQLREIREAASGASRELREAIHDLSGAENGGLSWAVSVESYLASQARLNGVRIRFRAPEFDRRLTAHHQRALYRIIAEAVGNAIRHGASGIVDVKLAQRQHSVTLRISDNGRGFDASAPRTGRADSGFGLGNMRSLAAALGGVMQIDSAPGSGTRIVVRLPLEVRT